MPGRKFNSGNYRFGFNGKENDRDEWGNQLIQDYGFRLYNPAIAKFLSFDPLAPEYPWYTPYQFAGNTPIMAIDLDGLEPWTKETHTPTSGFNYKTMQTALKTIEDSKRNAANIAKAAAAVPPHLKPVNPPKKSYAYTTPTRSSYEATTQVSKDVNSVYMLAVEVQGSAAFDIRDGYKEGDPVKMIGGVIEMTQWKKEMVNRTLGKAKIGIGVLKPSSLCFTAGTIVKTSDGDKNIENIIVGDLVWSYDDSTGNIALKVVAQLHYRITDQIYKIYVGNEVIEATAEHPFYVNGTYKEVQYLIKGDTLKLIDDSITIIDSIKSINGSYPVYNFTVNDFHTYFVGIQGILVHNTCFPLSKVKNWNPVTGTTFGHTFKRHGKKQLNSLIGRLNSGNPLQGHWLDDTKAANYMESIKNKIADLKAGEFMDFDLPKGIGQVLSKNDAGEIIKTQATKVRVVRGSEKAKSFIKTAFPTID